MTPELSVILMVESQRARCERALASVLRQSIVGRIEVILLDMGGGLPPLAGAEHGAVRCFALPRGLTYGAAASYGVVYARAPVVAFLEEHTWARPGWAEALVRAHAGPWAAVGPEVSADVMGAHHDPIELISGGPWSPPAQRGEQRVLRWQNVSYKRATLLRYGALLPDLLSAEGTLFQVLRRDGERLYLEPEACILHSHEMEWRTFLRGSFVSNRLHAARRARLLGYTPVQRGLRVLNALVTPPRALVRLRRRLAANPDSAARARSLEKLRRLLPQMAGYYALLAAATVVGLVAGEGESARQFLAYELNEGRDFAPLDSALDSALDRALDRVPDATTHAPA